MKNELIAIDDRFKCKEIKVQICSKSKINHIKNYQEVIKTNTLMNKTAF